MSYQSDPSSAPESWRIFLALRDELEALIQEQRRIASTTLGARQFPDMSTQAIADRIAAICVQLHGNPRLP